MQRKIYLLMAGTLLSITLNAQTKIKDGSISGTPATPDASAILDLESANKGFLAPRVALTSRTDVSTIPSPAIGLLIYNTGADALTYQGYVFWNGSEWRTLSGENLTEATITGFQCNSATLNPSTYTTSMPYSGVLSVPYIGGNGGMYPADTITVNGLTAILPSGRLNGGAGSLVYEVSGTPIVSSPSTTTFSINMGGVNCDAVVGSGDIIGAGEMVYFRGDLLASSSNHWLSDSIPDLPVLGGKIRLDGWFNSTSNGGPGTVSFNPRLVNISSSPVKLWMSAITTVDRFNGANVLLAADGGYANLDNGIYFNYGDNDMLGISTPRTDFTGGDNRQEVLTCDLYLDGVWYRIYYFGIVDNMNTVAVADNKRIMHISVQRLY